ncbi:MAG: T9SS type A sorting domain-containing protein [Saprospiraceae bacterium]|nr:T9SS type A sorting domain-containing protein [Saprospiraceae bacterium]
MQKVLILLLFFLSAICNLEGQSLLIHVEPGKEKLAVPEGESPLVDIFRTYGVAQYWEAFPGAKSSFLKGSRYMSLVDPTNIEAVVQALEATQIFDLIEVEEAISTAEYLGNMAECPNPVPITDPNTQNQTYFDLMEFPCAWSITEGCPEITIGLCDVSLNYNHPDLAGKIADIQCITCNPNTVDVCDHGFATAGALAAKHNDQCVAGAGRNTILKGYLWSTNTCGGNPCGCHIPTIATVWAAYNDGNRIILAETPRFIGVQAPIALQEMVDGGTTIILPSLTYPQSPNGHSNIMGINGVIVVGPLDDNLDYWEYNQLNVDMEIGVPARHAAHNVDDMWQLDSPDDGDGLLCRANYGGGTSIGAPSVAAAAALLLCVNPCLTPGDIETILKATAKPANGAPNNSGSLNAYQAVLAAQNAIPQDLVVGAGQTVSISNQTVHYSNITIEPTGTLHISNQSTVKMHFDGRIFVQKGAKLIVDNSTLTTTCLTDYWAGIRVQGNPSLPQPAIYDANNNPLIQVPLSADDAGVVFLLNNSTVEKARLAISTNWSGAQWGGVVFAKNTDFINNRRVAEFMQYPTPNAGLTFTNTSKFIECLFDGSAEGSTGVTMWDTDKITFNKCNFVGFEHNALVAHDAGAVVSGNNNFINNGRAISNVATYPFGSYPLIVDNHNYFASENSELIASFASDRWAGLKIEQNEFYNEGAGVGVWLDGPSNFNIDNNAFYGMMGAVYITHTGFGNDSKQNMVRCNTIQNANWGIGFVGDNQFVQFLSNDFQQVGEDVIVTGTIRNQQGAPGTPAANCFDNLGSPDITSTGTSFSYFVNTSAPFCEVPVSPVNFIVVNTSNKNPINCLNLPETLDPATGGNLPELRQQLADLQGQLVLNPENNILQAEWHQAMAQKEALMKALIKEKIAVGDYAGIDALLEEEHTLESDMSRFGLRMSIGAYAEAEALLNTFPHETQDEFWFVKVQQINLQRLLNPETFELAEMDEALLNVVAESQSPYRGFARAILMLLKGNWYACDVQTALRSAEPVQTAPVVVKDWVLAPNPANNTLQISLGKIAAAKAEIKLFDVYGRMVKQADASGQQEIQLETSQLPEGVYYVILTEGGFISKQTKISIQH